MHRYRFFCQDELLLDSLVSLSMADSHHCLNVLRLDVGEVVHLFNGEGLACAAEICVVKDKLVSLVIREVFAIATKRPDITLVCGWLKSQKNELIVQKCTELGVQNFVFLQMDNCVAKFDDKKIIRLNKIALEACKQSGRTVLPKVDAASSIESGLQLLQGRQLLWINENERQNLLIDYIKKESFSYLLPFAVIIGPESGFSEREAALLESKDCHSSSLGFDAVLRSETAAIAVTALLSLLATRGKS
jgi:16S rRNA (uracil1498-N3)-methyltransferase